MPDAPFSYDQLPYDGHAFPQTHPDRLAVVGRIMGLHPPDISAARVLELGCAAGENLIPMAYAWPQANFVGYDLSQRQIAAGQKLITQLGLKNIQLLQADILDLGPGLGMFDYILCHGVLSWVPRVVQDKIFDLFAAHLAPSGLGVVSYNVYPGWHNRRMIRDLMQYHATQFESPRERVAQARSVLAFMAQANTVKDSPYGHWLKEMAAFVAEQSDSYLYHEFLEDHNEPFYFHQFHERLGAHHLTYVGDSALASAMPVQMDDSVRQTLSNIAPDYVHWEQYLDYMRNRTFRYSIIAPQSVVPDRTPHPEALFDLLVMAEGQVTTPRHAGDDIDDAAVAFSNSGAWNMTTNNPIAKTTLCTLMEQFPKLLTFNELHATVLRRLTARRSPLDSAMTNRAFLASVLLQLTWSNVLHVHTAAPRYASTLSPRPRASALARALAKDAGPIPSLLHHSVGVTGHVREVLTLADGTRTIDEIAAALHVTDDPGQVRGKVRGALEWMVTTCLLEA